MILHQCIEPLLRPATQFRVAQGNDGGIARMAGDQGHLAHSLARHDMSQQAPAALVLVSGKGPKATSDDEIHRVGIVPGFEQGGAARPCKPFNLFCDTAL